MSGPSATVRTTIVIPTLGRPSLSVLLGALAGQSQPVPAPVVLVDDRKDASAPLLDTSAGSAAAGLDVTVVRGGGRGPAHARNVGWRHARTTWVSFLDDDVVPDEDWWALLMSDLDTIEHPADPDAPPPSSTVGSAGRVHVPLPSHRRATDWERGTQGLETAKWITADLTYRREALSAVGGFDERFPRAFREDADIALRLGAHHHPERIVTGRRRITHPVRPSDDLASLRQQAGNADDFLMRAVHGKGWQRRAEAPVGRRAGHVAITGAAAVGLAGLVLRRPAVAALGTAAWLAGTGEFAWRRIAPGPRDRDEVRRMLLTSAAIPVAATWHTLRGALAHRDARPWHGLPDLVLLDRDGTIVEDEPYNGDPAKVRPVPGARAALDRLRAEGVRLAVVSNQSGVARGLITREQVDAVNARVAELLGPFEAFHVCPHGPDDGCDCRKPAPGMLKEALSATGVAPDRAVMIGDIGADVAAAAAAGVSGVLVPTPVTRADEVAAAPRVHATLTEAVDAVLRGEW